MTEAIKIIENGFVVTCDGRNTAGMLTILVKGDRIAEISTRADLFRTLYPSAEIIDASGKILFPGFVDAHYHGESFVLRTFTHQHPLSRWGRNQGIRRVSEYVHGEATAEELRTLYRTAYFGSLRSGITTVSEYGMETVDASFSASFDALRQSEVRGFLALHNGDQIERARSAGATGRKFALVLPHEDDLTTYNLQSAVRMARELQWPLVIHYGETRRNFETIKKNFRKSIVQMLQEYHLFDLPLQITHLACIDPGDAEILAKAGAHVILNSRSVLLKETETPPVAEFLAKHVPLVLATDWGSPDPLANIQSFLTLCRATGAPVPSPFDLLRMHTINAAKVLRMHQEIGSLEPGKKADVTFLDVSDPGIHGFLQVSDPASVLSLVLFEMSARDVSDVMISGEFFVRSGQILTYSEEDLVKGTKDLVQRLQGLIPSRRDAAVVDEETGVRSPAAPVETAGGEGLDQMDEGFRVVHRLRPPTEEPQSNILPLPPPAPRPSELPKDVRKVFGEDEL